MSFRYAVIRISDGLVTNIIVADSSFTPPPGHYFEIDNGVFEKGGTWLGGVFTPPAPTISREGPWNVITSSPVSTSSNTLVNIPGFGMKLRNKTRYDFNATLWYRCETVNNGVLISVIGPNTVVALDMTVETFISNTEARVERITEYGEGTPTTSVDQAATDRLVRISGIVFTDIGNDNTKFQLQAASSVQGSSVTLRPGSRASIKEWQ